MGYRIENKTLSQKDLKHLSKIAQGKNGDVYRYRNEALKVFKENRPLPIDEETARYLQDITTERVLLPRKLLFYNAAFRGYTLKLIPKKGMTRRIISTDRDELVSGIESIEEDVEELSNRNVLLNGISPKNCIFNGSLYLSDPSKYSVFYSADSEELERINKYQLQLLLIELVSGEMHRLNYSQKQIKQLKELLSLRDNDEDLSTFFDGIMDGERTIKALVKKMGL